MSIQNQQILDSVAFSSNHFYYFFNHEGVILHAYGRLINKGILPINGNINELLTPKTRQELKGVIQHIEQNEIALSNQCCIQLQKNLYKTRWTLKKGNPNHFQLKGTIEAHQEVTPPNLISIHQIPLPSCIVSNTGQLISTNQLFFDFFNHKTFTEWPLHIQDLIVTNQHSPEEFDFDTLMASPANAQAILCNTGMAGNNQTFLLNITNNLTNNPAKNLHLITIRDITSFIDIQQSLELSNKKLQQKVKKKFELNQQQEIALLKKSRLESLGEIASGILHELNQPLAHLSLIIDNLFNKYKSQTITDNYIYSKSESVQLQIKKMRDLITEIKNFSHIENGEPEIINIREIINQALEGVSYINVKNLVISINIPKDLHTFGNPIELEQIIINLLINSLQSLDIKLKQALNHQPKIEIVVVPEDESIEIQIIDNGIGIPEAILDKIHTPFYTTKKEIGGSGLGLFIVNNLVRKLKGNITFKSLEKQYCAVYLTLPQINPSVRIEQIMELSKN